MQKSRLKYTMKTHVGKVRKNNQDCGYIPEGDFGFVAVADGMGGHNSGEIASKMAIDTVVKKLSQTERIDLNTLYASIDGANREILEYARGHRESEGMGTTFTCAYTLEDKLLVSHAGDSRAYLFSDHKLTQITSDHSYVAQLIRAGVITPEEGKRHVQRNIITNCLGIEEFTADTIEVQWKKGDILLLCSDGLHGLVCDEDIAKVLDSEDCLSDMCDSLVSMALKAGGTDNITVVLCQYGEVSHGG